MEHHIKRLRSYDPEKKERILIGVTGTFSILLLAIMVLLTGHRLNSFKEEVKVSPEIELVKDLSSNILVGTENEN